MIWKKKGANYYYYLIFIILQCCTINIFCATVLLFNNFNDYHYNSFVNEKRLVHYAPPVEALEFASMLVV